jgi:secreted trypsin-like serine protease
LIDSRHVLTASHCIGSTDTTSITIVAGLHNKYDSESDTRQYRGVERIFSHPLYNAQTVENDITILRLSEPVQFNKYVQPACLPGPDPKPDADVVLIGWGKIESNGNAYHELKQAKVKVIGECNKYWSQVDEEKQVCVGHLGTRDSACQGDSGGPMLYEHNGQWVVAGVTSFGSPTSCTAGSNFMPNVYTRVSAYLDWINSII